MVVSVSKTPGHTKHFQTIFLTPTVRLCDCPGLVFPSKAPKSLQVILGSYPIAQVQEPFSVVMYVAERLNLVQLLRIQHPEGDTTWSAMDICDGWALKRGFKTSRTGRLDTYRAANSILRMTLDGSITLCLRPPGYSEQKKMWEEHKDVPDVEWIQARLRDVEAGRNTEDVKVVYSSEEEEEDSKENKGAAVSCSKRTTGKDSVNDSEIESSEEKDDSGDNNADDEDDNAEESSIRKKSIESSEKEYASGDSADDEDDTTEASSSRKKSVMKLAERKDRYFAGGRYNYV